jgi:hypothetical protein
VKHNRSNRRAAFISSTAERPGFCRPSIPWDLDGVDPLFYMAIYGGGLDQRELEL